MWVLATTAAPQQPITTGSPAIPLWLWVLLPVISLLLTAGLVALATYPMWKDRKSAGDERAESRRRQKATQDEVLGCPADWNTGTPEKKGLVREFKEFRAEFSALNSKIGLVNGTGKTVLELVEDTYKRVKRLEEGRSP